MCAVSSKLVKLLGQRNFYFCDEIQLQDRIEAYLVDANVGAEREVILGPQNRLDFAVSDGAGKLVAVEIKIKGSISDLIRQIHRYAKDDRVSAILVVTSVMRLTALPDDFYGKPVSTCLLRRAI